MHYKGSLDALIRACNEPYNAFNNLMNNCNLSCNILYFTVSPLESIMH